jgi:hypothetical protein
MKMKKLNREQQFAWDMLTGNYEVWVKKLPPKEIAHTIGNLLAQVADKGELNKRVDVCLGFLMDRKLPPSIVVGTMRQWLTTYKLDVSPPKLSNFNRFHYKYNRYVLKQSYEQNSRI